MELLELLLQTLAPGGRLADTYGACLPGSPKTHLQVTTSVWVQMFLPCWVLFSRTGKYGALFGYYPLLFSHPLLAKGLFSAGVHRYKHLYTMQWQALFIFFLGPKSPCDNFPRLRLLPFITLPLTTPSIRISFRAILTSLEHTLFITLPYLPRTFLCVQSALRTYPRYFGVIRDLITSPCQPTTYPPRYLLLIKSASVLNLVAPARG